MNEMSGEHAAGLILESGIGRGNDRWNGSRRSQGLNAGLVKACLVCKGLPAGTNSAVDANLKFHSSSRTQRTRRTG